MAITKKAIIEAIHTGTSIANAKYESWSNGSWVTDSGVECLMVTYIAESVSENQEEHEILDLEVSFKEIRAWSEAKAGRGRRPATLKGRNRADIVLFNGIGRPTCVIEVKRTWNADLCWTDLERIRDLVQSCSRKRGGSLRRGFLAMMIAKKSTREKSSELRIEEQAKKIRELIDTEFDGKGQDVKFHLGQVESTGERFQELYGDWKSMSFCIEISSKNRSNM